MKKWLIILLVLSSCAPTREPMDPWEEEFAQRLKSEYIELFHSTISTSVNGGPSTIENFLELDVHNSKVIQEIIFNERVLSNKSHQIKDEVMKIPTLNELPAFNEIRIKYITTTGALFFKSEKTKTITYRVY